MTYMRAIILITLAFLSGLTVGCSPDRETTYPSENTLAPGIFLEARERRVLPPGTELRKIYDKGIELTKFSEGFVPHLYNDAAGYCTIAYGHLIKLAGCDGTEPEEFKDGMTQERGTLLLRSDMEIAEWAVMRMVNKNLTDGQFAALCDFTYNVGSGNLKDSTLLKVVNAGEFERVPFQFRRWVKAGGRELPGLKVRREKEIELFFEETAIPRAAPSPEEDLSPIDIRIGERG
jgi:GH24 family phage-related lysozyme (muramidase)